MDPVCQSLAVHFLGEFRSDETVVLNGRSTRIGSHPACHIVVPSDAAPSSAGGPAVDPRPLLWQVLCGKQGAVVRNWSDRGLLNGEPFPTRSSPWETG